MTVELPIVRFFRLPHARDLMIPSYKTADAAGADICAALDQPLEVDPGTSVKVPTGFAMALPSGWEAQFRSRSGLAIKRVVVTHGVGTIDADYRGEIFGLLTNWGDRSFIISHGDRIGQLVYARAPQLACEEYGGSHDDFVNETLRGAGAFGSTGIA